jgi:hypothetical protein
MLPIYKPTQLKRGRLNMKTKNISIVFSVLMAILIHQTALSQTTQEKPNVTLKMASNAPEGMAVTDFIKDNITRLLLAGIMEG